MKKILLIPVLLFFGLLISCTSSTQKTSSIDVFVIKYHNPLSMSQTTTVVNRMIGNFGPCKPMSITAAPNNVNVNVQFGSPCMTPNELKSVAQKTLPDNPVDTVIKSGF